MKKLMILAACGTMLAGAANAQLNFSPEVGVNLANMHERTYDMNGDKVNENGGLKIGVKAGVNADIWLGNRVSLQPGLFYSIKGAKFDDDAAYGTITEKYENNITLHYFEIPVNLQYYFNDPSEGRFFVGVGPYLGVAFSGKNKYHTETNNGGSTMTMDTVQKYHFGDDYNDNDLRRFDFGAAVNVGYLLRSGIFFRGMYQQGITNLMPHGNRPAGWDDLAMRNTNITISIGYMLGNHPASKGPRMKGSEPL